MSGNTFSKVSVIGLGYVGLPTAATLAARGVQVLGVDNNPHVVETINAGDVHIVEPGLDMLVRSAVKSENLKAYLEPQPSDAFMVAVPTPFKGDKEPDVTYVEAAADKIAPVLQSGNLVVIESTSPVGTAELISRRLAEGRSDLTFPHQAGNDADIQVAHCPERVLPGNVIREVVENDRIIGGLTETCTERANQLYKMFCSGECIKTDARTAELAKLVENSYRDVNIAFANELAEICDKLDINVWSLIKCANHHPRVNILNPGAGVGGHCIAVDPWFIVDAAPQEARIIRAAREINDAKPHMVVERVKEVSGRWKRARVALLGLAYKPDIDDLRESPALVVMDELLSDDSMDVIAVEPFIDSLPGNLAERGGQLLPTAQALEECDIIVFLVPHSQFKDIPNRSLAEKVVLDYVGMMEN